MTRPSKFDLMRAKRKPTREALIKQINRLEEELSAEWHAEVQELREVDMDAIHAHRKENTVRRWWWPLERVAAALRPHNNLER